MTLPISVIMMTLNEADNIARTLPPLLKHFDDVHVLDSNSQDDTAKIARAMGATVTNFKWNRQYPKKKQWGIDHLTLKHEWIFQIDADELTTDAFIDELNEVSLHCDGYFVPARMIWNGQLLKFGAQNNKLCLYKKSAFQYPVTDDLNSIGGWEVEGHYQPIPNIQNARIGQIQSPIIHSDTSNNWIKRHKKYAVWEGDMNRKNAWPDDPIKWRNTCKKLSRNRWFKPFSIFVYGYVLKGGFLDGPVGFDYAKHRAAYAQMINDESNVL
jgi:glycosyltransferase involved in cell wall biosynthesis